MPRGSHDDLPPVEIVPGYSSRLAGWDWMTVAFEKVHAGRDASSMAMGDALEQTMEAVRRNNAAGETLGG